MKYIMNKILTLLFSLLAISTNAQPVNPNLSLLDSLHEDIDLNFSTYNDLEKTIHICDVALELFPRDSLATIRKAGSLFYLHRTDDFIDFVSKSIQPIDSASTILSMFSLQDDERSESDSALVWQGRNKMVEAALQLSQKNMYANMSKALLEVDAAKFESSMSYIQIAIKNAAPDLAPNMKLIEAGIYADFNKNDEAARLLDQLILTYPDFKEGYVQRINLLRRDNKFDEALQIVEKEYAYFKDEEDYLSYKFYILKQAGRNEEACSISEQIGISNSYTADYAVIMGCKWNLANLQRNRGTSLQYEVSTTDATYNFTADITENYTGAKLDFDFAMTNQEDLKGHITILKSALDTAHTLLNQFSANMQHAQLRNATSVWVSDAVFQEINTNGNATINADGVWRNFAIVSSDPNDLSSSDFVFTLRENGEEKRVPCIHLTATDDSGYEIYLNDDAENPLILQMNIGFSVLLVEVSN